MKGPRRRPGGGARSSPRPPTNGSATSSDASSGAIVLLVIVSAVVFVIFYVFPSADPATLRAGRNATPDQVEAIRQALGLDQPVYDPVLDYMKGIFLHFDFGYSYFGHSTSPTPTSRTLILDRLPATIWLVTGAVILWLAIGDPGRDHLRGQAALAARPHDDGDHLAFISAPVFWLGLVALYLFADDVGLFPIFPGIGSYARRRHVLGEVSRSMFLPWIVLAAAIGGDLRPISALEHDRRDVGGLHPHGARQGPAERR